MWRGEWFCRGLWWWAPPLPLSSPLERILLVRIDDRVGNWLLTSPLLRALRQALPQAQLDLLCAERVAPLLPTTPWIDELFLFNKRWLWQRPWRLLRLLWQLWRRPYDLVIDAAHRHCSSHTALLLASLVRGAARIGHARQEPLDRWYSVAVPCSDPSLNEIEGKLALLQPLQFQPKSRRMLLPASLAQTPLPESWPSWINSLPHRPVVLNVGARKSDRRFSASFWAEVILSFLQREPPRTKEPPRRVILAWGPQEKTLAQEILRVLSQAAPSQTVCLAPPTDLKELAWLFTQAAVVVSADTGPMHLAVALNTPTLQLFRHDDAPRWGHTHHPHRLLLLPHESTEAAQEAAQTLQSMLPPL